MHDANCTIYMYIRYDSHTCLRCEYVTTIACNIACELHTSLHVYSTSISCIRTENANDSNKSMCRKNNHSDLSRG